MASRTTHFTRHLVSVGRPTAITVSGLVKGLVFGAFLETMMQYWVQIPSANAIPIGLLYLAGILGLVSRDRAYIVHHIFGGGALLILVSILSEVVSYYAANTYSIAYGLVFISLFIAARLIILQIGFIEVFRAYIYSAICCIFPILMTGHKELSEYNGGPARFSGGEVLHPNLLAFTLAGYIPALSALALDLRPGAKRLLVSLLAVTAFVLMCYSGSRGAIGSVLIAIVILVLRFALVNPVLHRIKLSYVTVLIGLGVLCGCIYLLSRTDQLTALAKFVSTALALDSKQRGIHSGFSGRTSLWHDTIHRITGLQWLFGFGYRQGFLIDSGYVTVLFDNGLVGSAVILGTMLRMLYWLWTSTADTNLSGWWRYRVTMLCMLLIYLLNNFTERFLFSYGNQFSLLILFAMVCRQEQLLGGWSRRLDT